MMKQKILLMVMVVMVILEALSFWQSWTVLSYAALSITCAYFFLCAWKKSSSIKLKREKSSKLWLWLLLVVGIVGEILIVVRNFMQGESILNALKFMGAFAFLLGMMIFFISIIKTNMKRKRKKTEEAETTETKVKEETEPKSSREEDTGYIITPEELDAYYKGFKG